MRKTLLLVAAAVTALFSACSGDELANTNVADGNMVNVSFSANLDQVMPTRSVAGESDGTAATRLYVAVYNADKQLIPAISHIGTDAGGKDFVNVSGKTATVNFQLVKGQTYNFVFWAQNPNATAGAVVFDPTTGKVNVEYSMIAANDETLDAFTAHVNDLTVTGALSQNVTLKRPWAQVNYGSAQADWDAAVAAGITVAKSKVTVNNVYTTLNALTGEVGGEATTTDVVLAANTIPASADTPRTLTVSGTKYKYIGLNYLLVGNEGQQSLIKADLEIQKADGTVINTLAFSNVPVQRNYRTNIVGNLLTSQTQFSITIDPNYEEPDYVVSVADQVQLNAVISAINDGTSTATSINLNPETGNGTFDFSGLTSPLVNVPITIAPGETVTISNLEAQRNVGGNNPAVAVPANTTVNIIKSNLDAISSSANARAINVEAGSTVNISGTKITGTKTDGAAYGSYSRGINVLGEGSTITVDGGSEVSGMYAFNLVSSAKNNKIIVKNSKIEGWAAVNIWNDDNELEFENCEINSVNKYSGTSNTFAAIVFNGKKNNKLTFTDCTITVKAEGDQAQYLVGLSGTGNEVYFKGNTTITGTRTLADAPVAYFASGMTEEDWIVDHEDTVVFNWSKD